MPTPTLTPTLANLLLVALGGAIGSALRYLVTQAMTSALGDKFPFGTLLVNILGCAAIGFLATIWSGSGGGNQGAHAALKLLFLTGVLGGFTTFSAFGLETQRLLGRGDTTLALANIALSVILGLAAVGVGMRVGKSVL